MKIIPEIKKVAGLNKKIDQLAEKLKNEIDTEGLDLRCARLISGCGEKNNHLYWAGGQLDNCGLVDDTYYCEQHTGYCEDWFYGTLYFKTDVPGQFVVVPFDM